MNLAITDDHYTTKINDRLDKVCYLRYGSDDNDIVVFVLEKNPGLDRQGILLTPGIDIYLPDAPAAVTTPVKPMIYLWT